MSDGIKKEVFCVSIVIQEFFTPQRKYGASCCFSQKLHASLWGDIVVIKCDAHLFSLFYLLISPFFLFSSQQTACHVHPSWPAALHIGFLVFLANRLGCASKGMIYALKWMNEKPYLSCFQIWLVSICGCILCCIISTHDMTHSCSFNNTNDNDYDDFFVVNKHLRSLVYKDGQYKTYYSFNTILSIYLYGQLKYWVEWLYFRHTLLHIRTGAA